MEKTYVILMVIDTPFLKILYNSYGLFSKDEAIRLIDNTIEFYKNNHKQHVYYINKFNSGATIGILNPDEAAEVDHIIIDYIFLEMTNSTNIEKVNPNSISNIIEKYSKRIYRRVKNGTL